MNPSLKQVIKLSNEYNLIPIVRMINGRYGDTDPDIPAFL